ncbi:MAG: hypothetical protein PWR31_524 [Bacillota bacterium]|nr:hypothetical protein [Bacillota bacterium]
MDNMSFFSSWSGGKDACLALYRAVRAGGKPALLFTTLTEAGDRTRAHGLPLRLIEKQAAAMGLPLVTRATSWEGYEKVFLTALREFKDAGVAAGIFGDIDLEEHRNWVERVCAAVGMRAFLPLWQCPRSELLAELLQAGFKATLIAVRADALERSFLGRTLDRDLVKELENQGVDPCGEQGEYHTVVTAGPLFAAPLRLELKGQVFHDGYWFQEVAVE